MTAIVTEIVGRDVFANGLDIDFEDEAVEQAQAAAAEPAQREEVVVVELPAIDRVGPGADQVGGLELGLPEEGVRALVGEGDQLAQQRRDGDHTTRGRGERRVFRIEVERAHFNAPDCLHAMAYPRRHPHGAQRRHDPRAAFSSDENRPRGRVDQLAAPMFVIVDEEPVG